MLLNKNDAQGKYAHLHKYWSAENLIKTVKKKKKL